MDCRGKQFRLHTVPLTQIRPFVTNEIILAQHRDQLDPDDNHIDIKVTRALEEEVRLMILNAKEKQEDLFDEARIAGSNVMDVIAEQQRRYSDTKDHPVLRCTLVHPEKVLTRVRVEHSGFSTLNNQRFGAKFVDEIANSDNILLFHRKKSLAAGGASGPRGSKSAAARKMDKPMEPDELEGTHMEDLVRDFLEMPNQKLKLLEEKGLAEAMEAFVEKNTTNAIPENAKSQLIKKQKTLITNKQVEKTTDIQEAVEDESKDVSMSMSRDDDDDVGDDSALLDGDDENAALKRRKGAASKTTSRKSTSSRRSRTDDDDDDDDQVGDSMAVSLLDDEDDGVTPAKRRRAAPSGRAASKSRARAAAGRLDDDDDDVIEIDAPPKKARAAAGRSQRTATKKKVNYSVDSGDEDDEDGDGAFESRMDEDDDEEVLVVDEPVTKKKTARGRAAAPKKRAAPTRKTTSARSKRATSYLEEDDDGDFNGSGAPSLDDDWGSAATRSQL
uniref:Mre11 DNA-binding domain-containing protein n=1 Tax=Entomoneis paludosa TaxID=265537 RepID=A0A7S2V8M3_9STRA